MTRPAQKDEERRTLAAVIAALALVLDRAPEEGERPDFILIVGGRRIGVEVTTYQSGATVEGGMSRRMVESENDLLLRAGNAFRNATDDLRQINAGLMFIGPVPPRKAHQAFIEEITAFIRQHSHELTKETRDYWPTAFKSPLMSQYLRTLCLRVDRFAVWHSSLSAGWVGRPDATLAAIVAKKSGKLSRPVDERWLAIQGTTRISEMLSDVMGVEDFNDVPSLDSYSFDRIFLFAATGAYQWHRGGHWRSLGEQSEAQGPSFDELMNVLRDPQWLGDPDEKATKVAEEVIRELKAAQKA